MIRLHPAGRRGPALLAAALLAACNSDILGGEADSPDMAAPVDVPFTDLPAGPVGAGGVTPDKLPAIADAFGKAMSAATGGPCVTEPTLGALFPKNLPAPLFEWTAGAGQNLFELRLHVENQTNDLLVYTDQPSYTPPDALWAALAAHSADRDIQVTVRGAQLAGGQIMGAVATGSSGPVRIAPVEAGGTIVYWTTSNNTALKGFHIGDKTVQTVLSPASITAAGKPTACVGCHTSSPDGALAFFGRGDPSFSVDARLVDGSSRAPAAGQVTQNALANLARTQQDLPTLSRAHYSATDAVVITVMNNDATGGKWELVWTDLHATSGGTGVLPRAGDGRGAATPAWSHDGARIAYTSASNVVDARVSTGTGEIWTVPYNDRRGGQAAALPGVNGDPRFNQYYPVYSPGDTLLAFNRNAAGEDMYNSASAEVYVAPGRGGAPTRVPANDPPACAGPKSPGLTNSWPRWSPSAGVAGGRHYYWLVFSSRRRPGKNPQLYLSAVVTKDGQEGEVLEQAYPAVYLTAQPASENNHTPAWDEFMLPPLG